MALAARERLIVALDLPTVKAAEAMVAKLGETVCFYKIGYQLAFAGTVLAAYDDTDLANAQIVASGGHLADRAILLILESFSTPFALK